MRLVLLLGLLLTAALVVPVASADHVFGHQHPSGPILADPCPTGGQLTVCAFYDDVWACYVARVIVGSPSNPIATLCL